MFNFRRGRTRRRLPGGSIAVDRRGFIQADHGRSRFVQYLGKNSLVLAGVGTFIYAATGWLAMLNGGNFLDYSYLPFKAEHTNELHALGILFIEIGVTICVMMTIINILDAVVERGTKMGALNEFLQTKGSIHWS